jgi:hypothetical protein
MLKKHEQEKALPNEKTPILYLDVSLGNQL